MTDERAEWVWVLTCRRCARVIDFEAVCAPIQRLAEWATCCGQVMELESVLRSSSDGS
jgi:hypothetical protein